MRLQMRCRYAGAALIVKMERFRKSLTYAGEGQGRNREA